MAKTTGPGKNEVASYTLRGTDIVVRGGDYVLMRPLETGKPPYEARVEKIEAQNQNNVKVRVRWYYRPEDTSGEREQFHGAKGLFLSDRYGVQSANTIEEKCTVHSFKNYEKLENVGDEDYYFRFEYKAATGVAVCCNCEMPDDLILSIKSNNLLISIFRKPCLINIGLSALILLFFFPRVYQSAIHTYWPRASKVLFLSDRYDVQSANTIEGKCGVHSFKNYAKQECRIMWWPRITTLDLNTRLLTTGCDKLDSYVRSECSSDEAVKNPRISTCQAPPPADAKVELKTSFFCK